MCVQSSCGLPCPQENIALVKQIPEIIDKRELEGYSRYSDCEDIFLKGTLEAERWVWSVVKHKEGSQGRDGRQVSTIQLPLIIGGLGSHLPRSLNWQMPKHPKPRTKSLAAESGCHPVTVPWSEAGGRDYWQPVSTVLFSEDPCGFLTGAKRGNIRENKLLSYCIALVHLPNKRKGLMWRHLQKTRWQTHPTRGCRYPAKRQIIYLTGKSGKISQRGKEKGKRQKNPVIGGLGLSVCMWVFWKGCGQACGHSSN